MPLASLAMSSSLFSTDQLQTDSQVPLGDLDSGVLATLSHGGVVRHPSWSVQWWIGAEDRWHRPDVEPSTRQRWLKATPVVESVIKIPSGSAVCTTAVARRGGSEFPGVLSEVRNDSPIPVGCARVLASSGAMLADERGLFFEGEQVVSVTRGQLRFAGAESLDALAEMLAKEELSTEPVARRGGVVAVVAPLPHTATAAALVHPVGGGTNAILDRAALPTSDQIVAGWQRHVQAVGRVLPDDPRDSDQVSLATAFTLIEASAEADTAAVANSLEALCRIGAWPAHSYRCAELLTELRNRQRLNGSFEGENPLGSTVAAISAMSAAWSAGISYESGATLVGPIAAAHHWSSKKRRFAELAAVPHAAATFLAAAGTLEDLGQPEVASTLVATAQSLRVRNGLSTASDLDTASDLHSAAEAASAASAASVLLADLRAHVVEDASGLDFWPGFRQDQFGQPCEVHGIATRFGSFSCAIRWHGRRPALLWELDPWNRSVPEETASGSGIPTLRASALDPDWAGSGLRGEALLAEPTRAPESSVSLSPSGGSFS